MQVRLLGPDDRPALESFLERHAETSMFLRSNLRSAGMQNRGERYQADYLGVVADGAVHGVLAYCWNGHILVQIPGVRGDIVEVFLSWGVPVNGLIGPAEQVADLRARLGLADAPTRLDAVEGLYSVDLLGVVVPEPLASGELVCRLARGDDSELLAAWGVGYGVETLGQEDGPDLRRRCAEDVAAEIADRRLWVLERGGELVAMSAFNARLPDMVQVGGVWTPPALRSRGYARAVVAGTLLAARATGVTRAILFTGSPAAARAYEAIGFRHIGAYTLALFRR